MQATYYVPQLCVFMMVNKTFNYVIDTGVNIYVLTRGRVLIAFWSFELVQIIPTQ